MPPAPPRPQRGGCLGRRLDVHPCVRKHQAKLTATLDRVSAESPAHLGEGSVERGVDESGRSVRPHRLDQRGAGGGAVAVEGHVGERHPALPARQVALHAPPADADDEPAAELHFCHASRQGFSNRAPTLRQDTPVIVSVSNGEGGEMSLLISCECGRVVRGETEDEIVSAVEEHVAKDHRELVLKLSREDILAMSEEVDD